MRHRKTLYLGVFLVALGSLLLIARNGSIPPETIHAALALWPTAFIAAGAALLLRGTRLSLPAGITAALIPGLLLGGLITVAPDLDLRCGTTQTSGSTRTFDGRLSDGSTIDLGLTCGHLDLDTSTGDTWRLTTRAAAGDPVVDARGDALLVRSAARTGGPGMAWSAETWQMALPTDVRHDLRVEIDAGDADIRLDGARLGDARFGVDAGALDLDLSGATLERLVLDANAATVKLVLPSGGDFTAELAIDAGELRVCIPAGLEVRITADAELVDLDIRGLIRVGDAWETPGYAIGADHADVTLDANVGSVHIQLEGVCS